MIAALAFAVSLQAKRVQFGPAWAVPRVVETSEGKIYSGELFPSGPHTLCFLGDYLQATPRRQAVCEVDAQNGSVKVLGSFEPHPGGGFENVSRFYRLASNGTLMETAGDGRHSVVSLIDPATMNATAVFDTDFNGIAHPQDEVAAGKLMLPQMPIVVGSQGTVLVLKDTPTLRIASTQTGVSNFAPGTWSLLGQIVENTDKQFKSPWGAPRVLGDPDSGPFALMQWSGGGGIDSPPPSPQTAFLNSKWELLNLNPGTYCYDAGPHGFLIGGQPTGAPLECRDAETGESKWVRKDIVASAAPVLWVGGYAVASVGDKLLILDGATGQTVLQARPFYPGDRPWLVMGDVIIFRGNQGYLAMRLTAK